MSAFWIPGISAASIALTVCTVLGSMQWSGHRLVPTRLARFFSAPIARMEISALNAKWDLRKPKMDAKKKMFSPAKRGSFQIQGSAISVHRNLKIVILVQV